MAVIAPRFRVRWIIAILPIVGSLSGSFAKDQPVISPSELSLDRNNRNESDSLCLRRSVTSSS